jgi:hypothetical protein
LRIEVLEAIESIKEDIKEKEESIKALENIDWEQPVSLKKTLTFLGKR